MANPPKPKKKEKDLHSLISRLDALDNVLTVEGGKGGAGVDEDLDEFTRLKKNSAKMVAAFFFGLTEVFFHSRWLKFARQYQSETSCSNSKAAVARNAQ